MERKRELALDFFEGRPLSPLLAAYVEINHLKQLYRQGWLLRRVSKEQCESVADHTFGAALLALFLTDAYFPELDVCKVVQMTLLHEIGEIYAGDIVPSANVSLEEKHALESESVRRVFDRLPAGARYLALWKEFEAGVTPEARFVRQIDRLEMGLQAGVYAWQGESRMDEFFTSALAAQSDPELKQLMEAMLGAKRGNNK